MKKSARFFLLWGSLLLVGTFGCAAWTEASAKEVPRMSVDELKSRLADPSFVVIDVRAANDWRGSSAKIKGAIREVGEKAAEWAAKYPKDKTIVLYCA